ncbi:hypothetical protein EDC04DRAFT_2880207 [Pisolithus marmoratus]|nr:hypothetical protein EDC04DRAFT_2880207 [Pisolithus marmoratus]
MTQAATQHPTARVTTELPDDEIGEAEVESFEDELGDDEEEDEEEPEEIARRLKEQLWADISRAQAAQASERQRNVQTASAAETTQHGLGCAMPISRTRSKVSAALETMKTILALTGKDPEARYTLSSAFVPGLNGNVLEILSRAVDSSAIPRDHAKILSPMLVSLARSGTLFATMRNSSAPAVQLDKGKRRREDDEEKRLDESRSFKRPHIAHHDIEHQVTDAARTVSNTLTAHHGTGGGPLDPSIISSIQLQLHQIFLFAVTLSARGGQEMHTLQEIGGLIQVIGVLSGIQIGPTAPPQNAPASADLQAPAHFPCALAPLDSNTTPSIFSDIGTAVYPCLMSRCQKTFSRLFSLRAHQRIHAAHRPFRCTTCPASFARNHDLKRHSKLHEKRAWQCAGCDKLFSRRDAIKRHKNSSAARGDKGGICVNAAIQEVELDRNGDEEHVREGRRTKMWNDLVTNSVVAAGYVGDSEQGNLEEGELHGGVIRRMQAAVLGLHSMLQAHVSQALGTDHAAPPLHLDPTGGQATLASVIARAQMQNMASQLEPLLLPTNDTQGPASVGHSRSRTARDPADVAGSSDLPLAEEGSLPPPTTPSVPQLSLYGLSDEQKKLLEQAIANAASAAQAQAEAEAALEEDEDYADDDESDSHEVNKAERLDVVPRPSGH